MWMSETASGSTFFVFRASGASKRAETLSAVGRRKSARSGVMPSSRGEGLDRDDRRATKKRFFGRHSPATFSDEGAMSASMPMDNPKVGEPLGDPELRRFLLDFVKRRVPSADADDIVQTVLVEALVAKNRPS